jgi:hypothetical protein
LVLGLLNPSKADAMLNDPTVTRGIKRAKRLGCGSLIVWNVGAGRATKPKEWLAMKDPIGPENYVHIQRILLECQERAGILLVGWGTNAPERFTSAARQLISRTKLIPKCLGVTSGGHPTHPLYIGYDVPLIDYMEMA